MDRLAKSMTRAERLEIISRNVMKNGEVKLDDLIEQLAVSRMTIHRDLEELERRGVLRKIRNGATARPSSAFESNVAFRMNAATEAKTAIARYAAQEIENGDVILLDEGTSLLPIIPLLEGFEGLTIVSNFLPIIDQVAELEDVRLIALGGEYIRQFATFSGPICERTILDMKATRYFTSTTAISDNVAYHPDPQVANVKRAMMRAATKSYLLADTSKFGRHALHKVADLDAFDQIIINTKLSKSHSEPLRHVAKKVVVAPPIMP